MYAPYVFSSTRASVRRQYLLNSQLPFSPDLFFSKMASPPNYEEVNSYFRQRMEESRKIWSTRGRDGQIAAAAARKGTWRQLSGVPLMMHEIKHVGNRPFAWGFA